MKHLAALILLTIPTAAQNQDAPCNGVAPPAPLVDVVFETVNFGKVWSGEPAPDYLPVPIDGPDMADKVVAHPFEYVGELKVADDWSRTDELAMRPAPAPGCWAWQWGAQE